MWLRTYCEFSFEIPAPTPLVLMLRPRSGAGQWVGREEYQLIPSTEAMEFTDTYGNLCQRLIAPPGAFLIKNEADVLVTKAIAQDPGAPFVEIQNLPDSLFCYLLPSRYCESDRFSQMAQEITENIKPGYDQVASIVEWTRQNVSYEPGTSNFPVSAVEVNQKKSGVCRDLAHLSIALCRAISIPARLVVGYLYKLEPMDLHAWMEAYVGNRWYTFDGTQKELRGGYVSIGYGRDAADVAIFNQFGPPVFPKGQKVSVEKIKN